MCQNQNGGRDLPHPTRDAPQAPRAGPGAARGHIRQGIYAGNGGRRGERPPAATRGHLPLPLSAGAHSRLHERLVQNLIENAIRYNVPEGGWVHVSSGTTADGSARIQLSHTGPVVPAYQVSTLFEPFRRLGHVRVGSSGAGLGLSIVRAVARAHGGDVRAEARDGGGLTVTATLPPAWSLFTPPSAADASPSCRR
ncbi:sensor histidine kinase [Streptomyces sp. NPDC059874]|uniref:sensor histidine kinase n=1 Tax=Streptomyces sp. NPDC059874 TaxID=3346983 RepID=UPI0036466030